MDSSNHLYLMRISGFDERRRNGFLERLAAQGIAANVHYKPLPVFTAYRNLGWDVKDFPNAYEYYCNLVSLPLHTRLSDDDVEYVCQTLRQILA